MSRVSHHLLERKPIAIRLSKENGKGFDNILDVCGWICESLDLLDVCSFDTF